MRIIAGKHRSRRLLSPPEHAQTRPIPDRVKLALFNILRGHYEGATVLDAFAGTGALGLEAVSRGATRAVFVERDRRMAAVLQQNIDRLGEGEKAEVVIADALSPVVIARCPRPLKLAFLDPPYALTLDPVEWPRLLEQAARIVALMRPDGFLVMRTPWPFVRRPEKAPDDEAGGDPGAAALPKGHDPFADWDDDAEDLDEVEVFDEADDTDEAGDADDGDGDEDGQTGRVPQPRPADLPLQIAGADGPETHVYRHTAVHLYAPRAGV